MTNQDRFLSVEEVLESVKTVSEPDPGRRAEARASMLTRVDILRKERGMTSLVSLISVEPPKTGLVHGLRSFCDTLGIARQRRGVMLSAILSIVLAIAALTGGAVYADGARPGDSLYPVDRSIEKLRLSLALTDNGRADLTAAFAAERLEEIEDYTDTGTDDESVLAGLDDAIASLQVLLGRGRLSPEAQSQVRVLLDELLARRQAVIGLWRQGNIGSEAVLRDAGTSSSPEVDDVGTTDDTSNPESAGEADSAAGDHSLDDVPDDDASIENGSDDNSSMGDVADDDGDSDTDASEPESADTDSHDAESHDDGITGEVSNDQSSEHDDSDDHHPDNADENPADDAESHDDGTAGDQSDDQASEDADSDDHHTDSADQGAADDGSNDDSSHEEAHSADNDRSEDNAYADDNNVSHDTEK